jgi:hypothetical protein
MGMYDEIWWQAELPRGHSPESRLFQTKSLHRCLERYVVTPEGRLRLVGHGWQDEGAFEGTHDPKASMDTDFHGDIRLVSVDGEQIEYVARFTHGKLEWIQLMPEVPERVRRNLMSG